MTERQAIVFWFTGLSGAGKTTVAEGARRLLERDGRIVAVIDGDQVRSQLHRHLGFSERDIKENNALIAELCAQVRKDHEIILVPIISPYADSRQKARARLAPDFYEVYCCSSIATLVARDPKGLYAKASRGEIDNLIGFSRESVYEPPASADLVLRTDMESPATSVAAFVTFARRCLATSDRISVRG